MATLAEIGNFWKTRSGRMVERFLGACLKAAYAVQNEAPETVNHTKRLAWAAVILAGAEGEVEAKAYGMMRYAIASNASLQTTLDAATDGDIEYIVASQIDALA
jgi:hypothetical protein